MVSTFKIGIFDNEEKFISAIKSLQEKGVSIFDVFTPYPVSEVFHLLKRKSRLPTAAYFSGLFGILATISFLYYTSVISWPINYGGKPSNSFPSFIVITIVLTILTVTLASLALFSARSKLLPGRENTIFDTRATDDKFVIVIDLKLNDRSIAENAVTIMGEEGAIEILEKEIENVKA